MSAPRCRFARWVDSLLDAQTGNRAGDDQLLDLRGALENGVNLGVAGHALHVFRAVVEHDQCPFQFELAPGTWPENRRRGQSAQLALELMGNPPSISIDIVKMS